MNQISNVNLKVVQGDFPMKYGHKLETSMVNLLKTLGHFKITILKYIGKSIYLLFFLILAENLQQKSLG